MRLIHSIHDHLVLYAGIAGALALLVPQVRTLVLKGPKTLWFLLRAPFIILEKVTTIEATSSANSARLARIEKELELNGGFSTKDLLKRLSSYRNNDFWRLPRPALEMDHTGQVHLVSEALCELVRVANVNDLFRRSWLRFLKIEGDTADEFLRAFKDTAATISSFRYRVQIMTSHGSDRGEWELRLEPIEPGRDGKPYYCGHFSPICNAAKEIAGRNRWT